MVFNSTTGWIVLGVLVAGVAAWALATRGPWRPAPDPRRALPNEELVKTVEAANQARYWSRTIALAEELLRRNPNNPTILSALGGAWRNRAFEGDSLGARTTRNSLERWRDAKLGLAYFDSAMVYGNPQQRAKALFDQAAMYDFAGFHSQALEGYREVLKLTPNDFNCRARVAGILARMQDPSHGDTVRISSVQEDGPPQ